MEEEEKRDDFDTTTESLLHNGEEIDEIELEDEEIFNASIVSHHIIKQYYTEFLGCFRIAFPMAITYIFTILVGFIEIIYLSHLGTIELAAAGLGVIFCNGSGFSFGIGMLAAFDTLASQAFGTKSYLQVGIVFQRSLLIMALMSFVFAFLYFFSYYFLILFGQDPEIAAIAQIYTRWNIFGLYPFFIVCCFQRYCQNQSIIYPIFITAVFGLLFIIFGDYLLIYVFDFGFKGAPITRSISNTLSALMIWAIVWGMGLHKQTWGGWSKESLRHWFEYFKLGIPGIFMVCAEWWGFEMNVLFAGLIDTVSLDAMSIMVNIFPLFYMVPYSISIGASTRIGNHLGASEPKKAQIVCRLSLLTAVVLSSIYGTGLFLIRNQLPYLFTDDEDVAALVTRVIPISSVLLFTDSIMAVAGGIVRGTGSLILGASVNIGAFYLFGIPCGLILTFVFDFGMPGLILGLFLADVAAAVIFMIAIALLDWEKLSKEAIQRIKDLEAQPSTVNLLDDIELDEIGDYDLKDNEGDLYSLDHIKNMTSDSGDKIDIDDIPE